MLRRVFSVKKIALYLVVILITYFSVTAYFSSYNDAVKAMVYKYGSRGNVVIEMQSKLQKWGYYDGSVDGIYGYETYLSIKKFQGTNGLVVDGVAGDYTLSALGINPDVTSPAAKPAAKPSGKVVSNSQDVMLLARLINGEARGEPYEGQVAVGAVIMNRTRNPAFPNTIAGVIYQPGAFTAIVDGQINATLEQNSISAARDALNGWDPSGGAIYYFNPATATSKWIWSRQLIKVIGSHRFCQ
jgi:N-acetylmuramoyl-L-alanine amidase